MKFSSKLQGILLKIHFFLVSPVNRPNIKFVDTYKNRLRNRFNGMEDGLNRTEVFLKSKIQNVIKL